MGFLPAKHPRIVSTVAALRKHLEREGFVWRFHPRSQGHPEIQLEDMEGAFLPCTFWLASVLVRMDQVDDAAAILDKVDAAFGRSEIYSEEADPYTGAALGNMPLLFSHAEHLKAVMDCARTSPMTHLMLGAGKLSRRVLRLIGHH